MCLSWVHDEKGHPGSSIVEMTAGKPVLSSKPPRGGPRLRRLFYPKDQSLLKYEKHSFKCGEKHSFKCGEEKTSRGFAANRAAPPFQRDEAPHLSQIFADMTVSQLETQLPLRFCVEFGLTPSC